MYKQKIEEFLLKVEKPVQYLGNEINVVIKENFDFHQCLIFPDLYEIGMSGLTVPLLYEILNEQEGIYMERAFMPKEDMGKLLRENGVPLFSLETWTPLAKFDTLSFSLGYEACFSNVLEILDLAQIPVKSKERSEDFPLISAGGSCTYNPAPMSQFIDFFYLGEGEEVIVEVAQVFKSLRGRSKLEKLQTLSKISGVYVPSIHINMPFSSLKRRVVNDINLFSFPKKPLVSYLKLVHDRLISEIQRGCTRGCRFCQAGIITRPVRERSLEKNMCFVKEAIANTGYDEISLSSLSSSDYSAIRPFIQNLNKTYPDLNISLPSLRIDNFSLQLASDTEGLRKSSFTFAPEAGSQRMRDVINKGITQEDIVETAVQAFKEGWRNLKFYFMVGLPFETLEDIEAIYKLACKVLGEGRKIRRDIQITISVSNFVPKPHTPFQWVGQMSFEEMEIKHNLLKNLFSRTKALNLKIHDKRTSYIEGVFSRGDERIGDLIYTAWKRGAKMDGWREFFKIQYYREAAEELGIDLDSYLKPRDMNEVMPWEFITTGVSREYFISELKKSEELVLTQDCRNGCTGCGMCSGEIKMQLCEEIY
ncbi:MAG: TIGR03960 family B12-binding radical SAM protein [Fusobacteria bacterium]|nr:TIGR03960 family B12-binding radical SAM protein [Fusobacteriota bacterium]